jgi:hypothetical protein
MRKMKGSGNYLKNQVRKNLAIAAFCLFLFCIILFLLGVSVLYSITSNLLDLVGLAVSLASLGAFYYYLRRYRIYNGGWAGEKLVVKMLGSRLSDDYFLLNDLHLSLGGGDIDHIVLGPSGVFVLETKNWRGEVTCCGDEWHRAGRPNFKSSPSLQVKRNTAKIKQILDSIQSLRSLNVEVEGLVVFTNNHSTLHLNSPTVPVLKVAQLPDYIISRRGLSNYSGSQLEAIGKEILRQKN